jgi:hypothetical protein
MMKGMLAPHNDSRIIAWANGLGPTGLFVRYLIDLRPDACSLALFDGDRVMATAVSGRPYDRPEVESYWLHAVDDDALQAIAATLPTWDVAITYPRDSRKIIAMTHPHLRHSVRLFMTQQKRAVATAGEFPEPLRLDGASLEKVSIPPELESVVGDHAEWGQTSNLYGIVENDALVCIGETSVRDDRFAAVQRVFACASRQENGYELGLAKWLTDRLHDEGLTPVYVVPAFDAAAKSLAEQIGFEVMTELGYAN